MEQNVFQMLLQAKVGPLPMLLVMALLMFGLPAIAAGICILKYNKDKKDKYEVFGMKEAASIGIIGGADGPTAVFVTGNPAWLIAAAVVAVVVVVGGAVALYLHHKNKSDQ